MSAAGEPDAREQEGGLGLGRGDADIGGHDADRAGAHGDAVDGPDDRLQLSIALTRSPVMRVKASSSFISMATRRADDVVQRRAGTEVGRRWQEHHHVDVFGIAQLAKGVRSSA